MAVAFSADAVPPRQTDCVVVEEDELTTAPFNVMVTLVVVKHPVVALLVVMTPA